MDRWLIVISLALNVLCVFGIRMTNKRINRLGNVVITLGKKVC